MAAMINTISPIITMNAPIIININSMFMEPSGFNRRSIAEKAGVVTAAGGKHKYGVVEFMRSGLVEFKISTW